MSTRCNILVGDTQFYHHHDGDPEGVGADLKRFLEMVNQGYFGTYSYEMLIDILSQGLPVERKRSDGSYHDKEYELESPKAKLHGDIEYLYIIDNVNGKFSLYCIDVYKAEKESVGPIFWIWNRNGLRSHLIKPEYCMLDGSKATPVKFNYATGTATVHTPPKGKKLYQDGTDKQIDKTIIWIAKCCQVMYYDAYYEKNHVMMEFDYTDGDPEHYFVVFNIVQKDGKNIIDVTVVAEKYPTQDFDHPATPKNSVTKSTGATMFERNIRDWYHGAYENDSIYLDINPDGTFQHVIDALLSNNPGDNVYLWTADDTVVRERVFMELSEMLGTDYDLFYNCWLDDPEAKKKLASLVGRSAKKNKAPVRPKKKDSKPISEKPEKTVKTATLKIDTFLKKGPAHGKSYKIEFGDYNELRRTISDMFGLTLAPADQIHVFVDGKQIATVNFTTNPHIHRWWPIGETIADYDPITGALIMPESKQPKPATKPEVKVPKKVIPTPKPPVKPISKAKPKKEAPAPKPEKPRPVPKPKAEKPKKEAPKKAISRPVKKVDPTKVAQIFEVRVGTEVKGQFTSKQKAEALKRDLKKNGMKPKVVVIHR